MLVGGGVAPSSFFAPFQSLAFQASSPYPHPPTHRGNIKNLGWTYALLNHTIWALSFPYAKPYVCTGKGTNSSYDTKPFQCQKPLRKKGRGTMLSHSVCRQCQLSQHGFKCRARYQSSGRKAVLQPPLLPSAIAKGWWVGRGRVFRPLIYLYMIKPSQSDFYWSGTGPQLSNHL